MICVARNPKQDANLTHKLTASELRKGGQNSGKRRGELKTFKEVLMDGLTKEEQEVMLRALKRNAMRGNLPSMEFLLKMVGQHPDQRQAVSDEETGVILIPPVMEDADDA